MSRSCHSRSPLLAGTAAAALATMFLAPPALAQSDPDRVEGVQVLASHQRADHARNLADTGGFAVLLDAAPSEASDLALRDNEVIASARANRANGELAVDSAMQAALPTRSSLATGNDAVAADGGAVLVVTQRGLSATTSASGASGTIAASAGSAQGSRLAVAGNTVTTDAAGNDAGAILAMDDARAGAAASILGYQANDHGSDIVSTAMTAMRLSVGASTGSDLALTGNAVRALAYGNAFTSELESAGAGSLAAAGSGQSSVSGTADGEVSVAAIFATLSHQTQSGSVIATAGGPDGVDAHRLAVSGSVLDSAVRLESDTLGAAGYANQSANAMTLRLGTIAGSGAVAGITNVQHRDGNNSNAEVKGGFGIDILGGLRGTSLSLSSNSARSVSAANLAEGNILTVDAAVIGPSAEAGTGAGGWAGAAADGSAGVAAAFSVQSVQHLGETRVGASSTAAASVEVSGPVEQSSLVAEGNAVSVAATGNGATNAIDLSAPLLQTSAGLGNVQTSLASIRAEAGEEATPLGSVLELSGTVRDSRLSVAGNSLDGMAVGNSAANMLAADGAGLAHDGGQADAGSGMLANGWGASADFALANEQVLAPSGPDAGIATLSSTVAGRYGTGGDAGLAGSTLTVDGNTVRSTVAGSTAANRLTVAGGAAGSSAGAFPRAALSSVQRGDFAGSARSDLVLAAPAALDASSVSLSGNASQAYAVINEADNLLSVAIIAAGPSETGSRRAGVTPSLISGDEVAGNFQFASGQLSARATTAIDMGASGNGLTGSRLEITGNISLAQASANRAVNTVRIDAPGAGGMASGLNNQQHSTADVTATANMSATSLWSAPVPFETAGFSSFFPGEAPPLNGPTGGAGHGAPAFAASQGLAFETPAGGVRGSSLEFGGNTVSAAAYGNTVTNAVTVSSLGQVPAALITSQDNRGSVTALAASGPFLSLGTVSHSGATLSGNQVSASAAGNQATSTLIGIR